MYLGTAQKLHTVLVEKNHSTTTTLPLINTQGDMSNKDPGIRLFGRKIPLPESQIPATSQVGYQIPANSATMVLTHKACPKAILFYGVFIKKIPFLYLCHNWVVLELCSSFRIV